MNISKPNLKFPLVILKHGFMSSFSKFLLKELREFKQEEGGYLLGTFEGDTIDIKDFYHDTNADRTYGEIKLSTQAFSKATELVRNNENKFRIIGTWHTHPPTFGSQYSSTDTEVLFIDRMVLNASDPSDYKSPQVHLILSGQEYTDYNFYTLSVGNSFGLKKISEKIVSKSDVKSPPRTTLGLKLKNKKMGYEYLPYSPNIFSYALKRKSLAGLWRICDDNSSNLKWEIIFIENFTRNILSIIEKNPAINTPKQMNYYRIIPKSNEELSIQEYSFHFSSFPSQYAFEKIKSEVEYLEKNIIIENDQGDSITCSITQKTKISDLSREIQHKMSLEAPPLIWTLISPNAQKEYIGNVKIDKFGKIFPPDDVYVDRLLSQRLTSETPLYWASSEVNMDLVYELRVQRFEQLYKELNNVQNKQVLIIGMGLLGCEITNNIATIGIKDISIVDNGFVDWVNIYRQSLYNFRDVGKTKVSASAEKIRDMGISLKTSDLTIPSVLIDDMDEAYQSLEILHNLIKSADLVIGTLDSYSTRAVVQILCKVLNKPFLSASLDYLPQLSITQGTIQLFHPDIERCYGCGSRIKTQKDRGVCTNTPIEYPKIVGGIASSLILEYFSNLENNLSIEYKIYDDYRIERSLLNKGESNCELEEFFNTKNRSELFEKIITWLIN